MLIISVVFNEPKYIRYQYESLTKYFIGDFNYIIYSNCNNVLIQDEFRKICNELNIQFIEIPQNIHKKQDASYRAGNSLDYALLYTINTLKYNKELLVIDSDMFLTDEWNLKECMKDYDFGGIYWKLKNCYYYTNQLLYMNLEKLPNKEMISFVPVKINDEHTDCGGQLFYYFESNKDIRKYHFSCFPDNLFYPDGTTDKLFITNENLDLVPKRYIEYFKNEIQIFNGKSLSEIYDNVVLHLRSGSNWMNRDSQIMIKRFENYIQFKNYLRINI